jgi:chromosome segregation ATPase
MANSGDDDASSSEIDPDILNAFKRALRHARHADESRSAHSSQRVKHSAVIGIHRIGHASGSSRDLQPTRSQNSERKRLEDAVLELSLNQNRNYEYFNSRFERKESEMDQLRIENALLKEKVAYLEEHIKQLEKENADLRKELQHLPALRKELQHLQTQVSKLQETNDLYQEDIKAMVEERRQRICKE